MEKIKITAIIQARMGSKRLPSKMMMKIKGKPLIWYIINTAKKCKLIDEIILATTDKEKDKILIEQAKKYKIKYFAGNENDVLDRFYKCAKKFDCEIIVRLLGDCPLQDSKMIDQLIGLYFVSYCDYAMNTNPPTFPDGLDAQVFPFRMLEWEWNNCKDRFMREHIGSFIRLNKNKFRIKNLKYKENLSRMRWTVDEQEDFEFVKKVINKIKGKINIENVLKVLKKYPELMKINNMHKRNENYIKVMGSDI